MPCGNVSLMHNTKSKTKGAADIHRLRETPPQILSVTETAQYMGLHKNTVLKAIREGNLKVVRVGRRLLVPLKNIQSLIDSAQ